MRGELWGWNPLSGSWVFGATDLFNGSFVRGARMRPFFCQGWQCRALCASQGALYRRSEQKSSSRLRRGPHTWQLNVEKSQISVREKMNGWSGPRDWKRSTRPTKPPPGWGRNVEQGCDGWTGSAGGAREPRGCRAPPLGRRLCEVRT